MIDPSSEQPGPAKVRSGASATRSRPATTLMLLPGMDGTGELFAPFIAALGAEFKVKVVGYPVDQPLGYAELEALARSAIPARGPYLILGESFSGPIAVALATSAGPRLKGVVLVCTFVRSPWPVLPGMDSLLGLLPLASAPLALMDRMLLGSFSTGALRGALGRTLAKVSAPAIRARLRAVMSVDVSAKLGALKVPLLYLRASRDRLIPPGAVALISKLNPGVRVVEMQAPHFLLQAVPAEAAQVITAFGRELQDPASIPLVRRRSKQVRR